MRNYLITVIREAASLTGIDIVLPKEGDSGMGIDGPAVQYDFISDIYTFAPQKIASRRESNDHLVVQERYQVNTRVGLTLYHNDPLTADQMSYALIMAFPSGMADLYRNWMKIKAVSCEWCSWDSSDSAVYKPVKKIQMKFIWRLTRELITPYLTNLTLNIGESNE